MPTVFISYSWDDESHKQWIIELADRLVADGIDVRLDRYELRLGRNLNYFIEQAIKDADKVIIIFTPNYKTKADGRQGGVGYEYSILNVGLYKNITNQNKVIPVLRKGDSEDSIPEFIQQLIHLDLRDNTKVESNYLELIREIYDEPEIIKPNLGKKPNFNLNEIKTEFEFTFLPVVDRIEFSNNDIDWIINDASHDGGKYRARERRPLSIEWDDDNPSFFLDERMKIRDYSGKFGFIDTDGNLVIKFKYDEVDNFTHGYAAVKENGRWGLIDTSGETQLEFTYDHLYSPYYGIVMFQKYGKWSICNEYGFNLTNKSFDTERELTEYIKGSLNSIFDEVYPGYDENDDWSFRSSFMSIRYGEMFREKIEDEGQKNEIALIQGRITSEGWKFLQVFLDERGRRIIIDKLLEENAIRKKMLLVENNGLWGVKNEEGHLIFDYIFSEIKEFRYDRAFVRLSKKNRPWAIIDTNGNILCK